MEIISFYGQTPQIALDKAKEKFGDDALVIKTKLIPHSFGDKKQTYQVDIINYKSSSKNNELLNLKSEVSELLKKVDSLKTQLNKKSISKKSSNYNLLNILEKTGIEKEILSEILDESLRYIPQEIQRSPQKIEIFFYKLLGKLLKSKNELDFKVKKSLMLVGPTGVGKTTTIAKISAIASIIDYNYKVGIISLDNYRVGAIEQLSKYCKIMNLPMKSADDIESFDEIFRQMSDRDLILIDTAGSSPRDNQKIAQIQTFLQNNNQNITINLVLSANTKYADMLLAYEKFSTLDIESLIFTKLDETLNYGAIYSLIFKTEKPVSYFCIGQNVPDDIVKADGGFLIKKMR